MEYQFVSVIKGMLWNYLQKKKNKANGGHHIQNLNKSKTLHLILYSQFRKNNGTYGVH